MAADFLKKSSDKKEKKRKEKKNMGYINTTGGVPLPESFPFHASYWCGYEWGICTSENPNMETSVCGRGKGEEKARRVKTHSDLVPWKAKAMPCPHPLNPLCTHVPPVAPHIPLSELCMLVFFVMPFWVLPIYISVVFYFLTFWSFKCSNAFMLERVHSLKFLSHYKLFFNTTSNFSNFWKCFLNFKKRLLIFFKLKIYFKIIIKITQQNKYN